MSIEGGFRLDPVGYFFAYLLLGEFSFNTFTNEWLLPGGRDIALISSSGVTPLRHAIKKTSGEGTIFRLGDQRKQVPDP